MTVIKSQLTELGVYSKSEFCYNGEEAIKLTLDIITKAVETADQESIHPVCLMLLDFQMPRKNGIQVVEAVRAFVQLMNSKQSVIVHEPIFVFLTAFSTKQFYNHIKRLGIEHIYEKPVQMSQLEEIIQDVKSLTVFKIKSEEN
jgi:CheY-like chemotaxis protein